MKKYLFIILLVGVCFGQEILESDVHGCPYDKSKLHYTSKEKKINGVIHTRYKCASLKQTHIFWIATAWNSPCENEKYLELLSEIRKNKRGGWSKEKNNEWKKLVKLCTDFKYGKNVNPCENDAYKELLININENGSFDYLSFEQKELYEGLEKKCNDFSSDYADSIKQSYSNVIETKNPCFDDKYLELKQLEFDAMSEREFQYFIIKEKQCGEYDIWWKNKYDSRASNENQPTPRYNDSPTISSETSSEEPSPWLEILDEAIDILDEYQSNSSTNTLVSEKRCPHDGKQLMKLGGMKIVDDAFVSEYQCLGTPNHSFWYAD